MKTRKSIADSSSKAVAQLKQLKARGYQITKITSYSIKYYVNGIVFSDKRELQEYLESLRG